MNGLCETCVWWQDPEHLPTLAECWGCCRLTVSKDSAPQHPTSAYAIDGHGYFAQLMTRHDFGCVQHKPAEARA